MFRAVLYTQWKWSRWLILLGTVAAFAIPVLSVRHLGRTSPEPWQVSEALTSVQGWGMWYPVLAFFLAALVSTFSWQPDILGKHVYALSLPVPRWHYVLLRLGAGGVLLVAPVIAVWVGGLVAVSAATIPQGLHAYPHALAFRFALALGLLYAVIAGLMAMPKRFQGAIGLALVAVIALEVISTLLGARVGLASRLLLQLFEWPGPLEILVGRWMLVDV